MKQTTKPQRRDTSFTCTGLPRTKQSFTQECDINNIMAKYQKTGAINHFNSLNPEYGEHTPQDYHQSMNIIAHSNNLFEQLPSSIRKRFNNQPEQFLSFVQNPSNEDEMVQMGLAHQRNHSEPQGSTNTDAPVGQAPAKDVRGSESDAPFSED